MKIIYLIIITMIFFNLNLQAKIYKKILPDGTVHYYNQKEKPKTSSKVKFPVKYDQIIKKAVKKYSIDFFLIKCIIKVESNFNPDAMSDSGAMGLMQLMNRTGEYYNLKDPFDPVENINIGVRHFAGLFKYFKKDIPLTLAAYHAGLGRVKKRMAIPPIKSTINYVNRIMFYYKGKNNYSKSVKRLYKKIDKEGTLIIYSR